ncbi:MAG: hypothetical protein LBH25_04710 [Fibromonadaceae bacterium]|nr:hypothetical protein [Fibromonadaceae bacterium]
MKTMSVDEARETAAKIKSLAAEALRLLKKGKIFEGLEKLRETKQEAR